MIIILFLDKWYCSVGLFLIIALSKIS